jgi:hypothetical protein
MEITQNTLNFEVSTLLSSRETNNIIYFPDLVKPPSTNTFIDKTDDMDIDYPLGDENALEDFIITETQGFLAKLERELRPQPQFYALTGPRTHPGFYGAGKSEAPDPVIEYIKSNCSPFQEKEHKEITIEIENKVEKEPKKEKKQTKQAKTKQTKITSFTIKSNRKSSNCEEKSDNNGETSQKNTRKKNLSTSESSSRKKIKTNSGAEDGASKLPEEENNSEAKRDVEKPKKSSGNNRGRPKGSLNKNKKDSLTKNKKSEADSSLSTSTPISPNDPPTPKKRKYNRVSEKSTTSQMTPTREGGLGMILNTDNFVVNTTATMNSAMAITASSP